MSDTTLGVIILVVFLVVAYFIGRLLSNIKNAKFAKAWSPFIPIINGSVVFDKGGAASSSLVGTYQGRKVVATMAPKLNKYSGDSAGHYHNYFSISITSSGTHDWKITSEKPVLGVGNKGWVITAAEDLKSKLTSAAVVELASSFGATMIAFSAKGKTLKLTDHVTPLWVPTTERFEQGVNLLLQLATINEEVNAA